MAIRKKKKAKSNTRPGLDELLDDYEVGEVDDDHIVANSPKQLDGLLGWYWVCDSRGVLAYFRDEAAAFRFRLAEVNRVLNG